MAHIELIQEGLKLKKGFINLYGSTGKKYRNLALSVPGYGYVPCSCKLQRNFTTKSDDLILVISDSDDTNPPVTSDIWITCRPEDLDND